MIASSQQASLEARIRQSERSQQCLVPTTRSEGEWFENLAQEGSLFCPMERLYVRPEYWNRLTACEQALHCMRSLQKQHIDWVFAGPSAVLAHGLPLPDVYAWPIRVAVRRGNTGHVATPRLMRQVVEGDEPVLVNRLHACSLERAVFDCMREMDFADGLALADAMLAQRGCSRSEVARDMDRMRNTSRGGLHAMEAIQLACGESGGVAQSLARAAVLQLGFEQPAVQVTTYASDGRRVDGAFGWNLDDGSWVMYQVDESAEGVVRSDVEPGLRLVRSSAEVALRDGEAVRKALTAAGVPRHVGEPLVGKAKRFKPSVLQ